MPLRYPAGALPAPFAGVARPTGAACAEATLERRDHERGVRAVGVLGEAGVAGASSEDASDQVSWPVGAPRQSPRFGGGSARAEEPCGHTPKPEGGVAKRKRYDWASLLARVFAVDVLRCPRCATGAMQRIAVVIRTSSVRAILASVGLPADSPGPMPSRYPEQSEMFEVA